jgi:hypothetical protein
MSASFGRQMSTDKVLPIVYETVGLQSVAVKQRTRLFSGRERQKMQQKIRFAKSLKNLYRKKISRQFEPFLDQISPKNISLNFRKKSFAKGILLQKWLGDILMELFETFLSEVVFLKPNFGIAVKTVWHVTVLWQSRRKTRNDKSKEIF